jgi:hypothetical protein
MKVVQTAIIVNLDLQKHDELSSMSIAIALLIKQMCIIIMIMKTCVLFFSGSHGWTFFIYNYDFLFVKKKVLEKPIYLIFFTKNKALTRTTIMVY